LVWEGLQSSRCFKAPGKKRLQILCVIFAKYTCRPDKVPTHTRTDAYTGDRSNRLAALYVFGPSASEPVGSLRALRRIGRMKTNDELPVIANTVCLYMQTHFYVCLFVCIYRYASLSHTHTHIHTHARTHARAGARAYTHTHAHAHAHAHTNTNTCASEGRFFEPGRGEAMKGHVAT